MEDIVKDIVEDIVKYIMQDIVEDIVKDIELNLAHTVVSVSHDAETGSHNAMQPAVGNGNIHQGGSKDLVVFERGIHCSCSPQTN